MRKELNDDECFALWGKPGETLDDDWRDYIDELMDSVAFPSARPIKNRRMHLAFSGSTKTLSDVISDIGFPEAAKAVDICRRALRRPSVVAALTDGAYSSDVMSLLPPNSRNASTSSFRDCGNVDQSNEYPRGRGASLILKAGQPSMTRSALSQRRQVALNTDAELRTRLS